MAVRDGWAAREAAGLGVAAPAHASRVADVGDVCRRPCTSPRALDSLLTPAITQTQLDQPSAVRLLNRGLSFYWRLARPRAG